MQSLNREKRIAKMWATCEICKKMLKEDNHPKGENSPNLVTLFRMIQESLSEHKVGKYFKNKI
jgi:hypothetical protein